MSRIGKQPIQISGNTKVKVNGNEVMISGPKGKLSQSFHSEMSISMSDGILSVTRPTDSRHHRALHGLTRSLLNNMVIGVNSGYSKRLVLEGVGYRAELKGSTLVLSVGYSHPVTFKTPKDMKFTVEERGKLIIVEGIDKQALGEICAQIRKTRPPEPFKGKGIRYEGEYVRRKAGKAGKV